MTPRALRHGDGGKREPAWSPAARSEPPRPRHPDRRRTAFGFVVLVLAAAAVLSLRVGAVPFVPGFPRPVSGGQQDARLTRPFVGWLFRPFPGALLPGGAALLSELRNLAPVAPSQHAGHGGEHPHTGTPAGGRQPHRSATRLALAPQRGTSPADRDRLYRLDQRALLRTSQDGGTSGGDRTPIRQHGRNRDGREDGGDGKDRHHRDRRTHHRGRHHRRHRR